jgi:hypothetical protein
VAKERTKRKRKKKPGTSTGSSGSSGSGGGGVMQSLRSGMKAAAGVSDGEGKKKDDKPSTLSNVIWGIILIAAVAFLLYRWYG